MDATAWSQSQLQRVATMYYVQDETMEAIALRHNVSRSTVSRQLKEARRQGIVRISVVGQEQTSGLGQRIEEQFGVVAHVVPVRETASESHRLAQVARVAGSLLSDWMDNGTSRGLAWGITVSTVVEHLVPKATRGATVVQLNGAVHVGSDEVPYVSALLGRACEAFDARPVYFPVPAFFDDPATKAALWRERSVAHVVDLQRACDIAVFGVGAWRGGVISQVYAGGYLRDADLAATEAAGAVGDVCTMFVRGDGSYADIPINARSSALDLADLARIPRRLCVAVGVARVPGVVGALRAGVVSDLVLDEDAAAAVLDFRPSPRPGQTRPRRGLRRAAPIRRAPASRVDPPAGRGGA
jgi:DNA-binding transcriptional regulator LsrR (DeoR family)